MTRIGISIEHKNLPLTESNIFVDKMSPEEIIGAVARFEHELPMLLNDDTLTVTKPTKSVHDRETIYFISSSLGKAAVILAIERTLTALKLGGYILKSTDEIKVGSIEEV